MDADDILDSEFYLRILSHFQTDPMVGMVYSRHQFINESGCEIPHSTPSISRAKLTRFWISNIPEDIPQLSILASYCWSDAIEPMCIFRRSAYENTSGWHPKLGTPQQLIGEGALLMTELALEYRILRTDEKLYKYRIHSGQATKKAGIHAYALKHLPQIYKELPAFQTKETARLIWYCELTWKYRLRAVQRIHGLKHNLRFHFFIALSDVCLFLRDYLISTPILLASRDTLARLNQSGGFKSKMSS
jgi:hypothetical protein